MTGRILIADALMTGRIVLKARLSAAFYDVLQADSGAAAVEEARRARPDLVLLGGDLPDMGVGELVATLARGCGPDETPPPVIALLPRDATDARIAALGGGAADVIGKPCEDGILLARLRSLLRQRHLDTDLGLPAATADALGFAEEPAAFRRPPRLAILAGTKARAEAMRDRLAPVLARGIGTLAGDDATTGAPGRGADAILLEVDENNRDSALSRLAGLQTAPDTRQARIIALLDACAAHLAAPMLDMGASEAVLAPVDERELALRLAAQIERKTRADALRWRLESGLQAAVIDPLTGLYNRRYGLSFLRRMISQPRSAGGTCALMVADLDHFKAVNDTHGHAAGDRVLAQVSARMQAALPPGAMLARIGGEEFLVAVPDTSLAVARGLAGKLCRRVRQTPVALPGEAGAVRVTVSIGVTIAAPEPGAGLAEAEALLAEADRALYASKSGGRDTVTVCARSAA